MAVYTYPTTVVTIADGATATNQLLMISELQDINTELDAQTVILTSLDAKDFATQTTLASIDAKDFATETTLAALNAKATAIDTGNVTVASSALPTGAATSANQTTANSSLSSIEADITSLNNRVAGNLVPEEFDHLAFTYVAAGNGLGEIETVTYKTGGAGGTTVATLTLGYDANDNLSSVARS